jgi:hypothetical protein
MFKLLSGTIVVLASIACGNGGNMPGGGGNPPSGASISFPGGHSFQLLRGDPVTLAGLAGTASASDSVVVMGGQQCVITVSEVQPPTDPPKYRMKTVCR